MIKIIGFFFLLHSGLWLAAQDGLDSTRMVKINAIHIIGNRKTKKHIITRELVVAEGDSLPLSKLKAVVPNCINNIYNTTLFDDIEISLQDLDYHTVDIEIKLKERWYIYPAPIFKIVDRNFNDWWVNQRGDFSRINYGILFTHFNFRGRAEKLRISAITGFENKYSLNYRIPYLDKNQKLGLYTDISYNTIKNLSYYTQDHFRYFILQNDILVRSLNTNFFVTYRDAIYNTHEFGLGFSTTSIADTLHQLNPNFLSQNQKMQSSFNLKYNFIRRNVDNINYPLYGQSFVLKLSKEGFFIFDDINYLRVQATVSKYWDIGKNFYIGQRWVGEHTFGNFPFNHYSGLGFDPYYLVRGFELDLIEGRSYMISKNTLRKTFFKKKFDLSRFVPIRQFQTLPLYIYGKIFFDAGYVWNLENYKENTKLTDKLIYSIGSGIDIVTLYDFILRFEYSFNSVKESHFFFNLKRDI